MSNYHSDQPIKNNMGDELNRGVFVYDFSRMLLNLEKNENYIIGIFARWGFGKTSTINLILNDLGYKQDFCTVYVSSWALGGDYEKILWDILNQISSKIDNKKAGSRLGKIGRIGKKLAKAELPFGLDVDFDLNGGGRKEIKVSSGKIVNTVSYISQILSSSDNIAKARKRIEKSIKGKRVIVFIDDLDRLEGKQILAILRAINTVADYGGVTYVLPFDKRYVCSAIEECLPKGQSGDDFIEKIIQVPINLPALTQEKIDKVMLGKLDQLFSEFQIRIAQEEIERFQKIYYRGANKYLGSPRDINKLINVLRFKLPIANGEINRVDTIILEIIRVFDEPLYEMIRINRETLVKQVHNFSQNYLMNQDKEKRKRDADSLLSDLDETQHQIIQNLFPVIEGLYTNMVWSDADSLRRLQRISSENYFDLYFASLDEEDGISDKKIIKLLQLSDDPQALRNKMIRLVNQNNFGIAIKTMIDRIDLIENKVEFCNALLDLVETFPDKYSNPGFGLSSINTLTFRIDEILKISDTKLSDYISLLDYSYEKGRVDTIPILIREIVLYSKKGEHRWEIDLTEDQVKTYKEHALGIIRKLAEQDKIPIDTTKGDYFIYSYWVEFGDMTESCEYIKRRVKTSDQVVDFISQFLGKSTEIGKEDYRRTDLNEATYKMIGKYIELEYLYDLLAKDSKYQILQKSSLNELVSFEDYHVRHSDLPRVGNEHTDEFRQVVARKFMYIYENEMLG